MISYYNFIFLIFKYKKNYFNFLQDTTNLLYVTKPKRQLIYNFFFFNIFKFKFITTGQIVNMFYKFSKSLKKDEKSLYNVLSNFWYYYPNLFLEYLSITFKNFNYLQFKLLKNLFVLVPFKFNFILINKSFNKILKKTRRIKKKTLKTLLNN